MSYDYSVERKLKQQKLRRKARRGEIAIRRLYKFLRFIFVLFLFYCVYRTAVCHYWYYSSDLYTNKENPHIEILGNKIVSNEKIINEIKKIPIEHKPLYMINPSKQSEAIEKLAPVRRAYIRRFWFPARYVIMVEEVIPAISISPAENTPAVAVLAHTGELITREFLPLNPELKTAAILSYGTKGDDYEKWDVKKIEELYNLNKLLEEYSGEKVLYIDLRNPQNVFAQLESVKIQLGEINKSLYDKIKTINPIIQEVKKLKEPVKYIDISWKDATYLKMEKNY